MPSHQSFLERLRARPVGQRYIIVWCASITLFVLVFWLWLYQVKSQLASLTPLDVVGTSVIADNAPTNQNEGILSQLAQMAGSMQSVGASVFSFIGDQLSTAPKEPDPVPVRQGNELDQFLDYQPFPDN